MIADQYYHVDYLFKFCNRIHFKSGEAEDGTTLIIFQTQEKILSKPILWNL